MVAFARKKNPLLFLDLVLAIALISCILSAGRIFGPVFFYLVLWSWCLCALMTLATVWGAIVFLQRWHVPLPAQRVRVISNIALAALLVAIGVRFQQQARKVSVSPSAGQSAELGQLVTSTELALRTTKPGRGHPTYLVAFDDPYQLGSQAFGLLDELERAGYRVGVAKAFGVYAEPHRVLQPRSATAELLVAVGPSVAMWESHTNLVEVAKVDPSTPLQRYVFQHLSAEAASELRAAGRTDLIPEIGLNLFSLSADLVCPPENSYPPCKHVAAASADGRVSRSGNRLHPNDARSRSFAA